MRSDRGQRLFDVVVAAGGLAITAPIMIAIAFAVRASSRGPALHRAQRVGRDGKPFTLLKFRSMRIDAAATGPGITAFGDSRVTPVGRVIRRSKLDELPQLLNVIRGDMSIVGPRPEDARYVAQYSTEQRLILTWRPGITSPASVTFRDEERLLSGAGDLEQAYLSVMAKKISIDLEYFPGATMLGDVEWIGRTLQAIVRR